VEEKRQRLAEQEVQPAQGAPSEQYIEDGQGPTGVEDLEEEADEQGAFNPETGEINWDCPCLGGMAHGPCGEEFKAAFSCFVYSKEEPKGMECIDKFKYESIVTKWKLYQSLTTFRGMQDCFRQHPEMYGSELEDDEVEPVEELRAEASPRSSDASHDTPAPASSQLQSPPAATQKDPRLAIENSKGAAQPVNAGDDGGELVPKAAHDGTSK
jgi:intermembrane space import and assembly protein 40